MKILHVGNITNADTNGVQRSIRSLAHLAQAEGSAAAVLRFSRSADTVTTDTVDGISITRIPTVGPKGPAGGYIQRLRRTHRKIVAQLIDAHDIIHLHSVYQIDHVLVGPVAKRPIILTPHGGYHVAAGGRRIAKRIWELAFEARLLRRVTTVHALTLNEACQVHRIEPRSRCAVAPLPIGSLDQISADPVRRPGGPVVFIGRIDIQHKGLDLLVRAWAESCRRSGRRLVIAGAGQPAEIARLKALIRQLDIDDEVSMPGEIRGPEKDALLRSAQWFIHTSRWEGIPLSMIEAAAHGIPLMATSTTNLDELVRQHVAGRTSQTSVDAIASMLREALTSDVALLDRYARGSVQLAERFTPANTWPSIRAIYESALA